MTKTYTVCIEEVCSQEFEIEAEDAREAEAKAIKMYKNSEIVLEDANLVEANIAIVKPEDEITSFNTIY